MADAILAWTCKCCFKEPAHRRQFIVPRTTVLEHHPTPEAEEFLIRATVGEAEYMEAVRLTASDFIHDRACHKLAQAIESFCAMVAGQA